MLGWPYRLLPCADGCRRIGHGGGGPWQVVPMPVIEMGVVPIALWTEQGRLKQVAHVTEFRHLRFVLFACGQRPRALA